VGWRAGVHQCEGPSKPGSDSQGSRGRGDISREEQIFLSASCANATHFQGPALLGPFRACPGAEQAAPHSTRARFARGLKIQGRSPLQHSVVRKSLRRRFAGPAGSMKRHDVEKPTGKRNSAHLYGSVRDQSAPVTPESRCHKKKSLAPLTI
jgi:hypothetical protein